MSIKPDLPNITPNTALPPFKAWVQMAIPTVYDDSLSYYELLCKVIQYLNDTNDHLTNVDTNFNTVYTWILSWFDELDVDDTINEKVQKILDTWSLPYDESIPQSGTLDIMLNRIVPDKVDSWLAQNIQQETINALDSTLLLANAGAQSKAVGDAIYSPEDNTSDIHTRLKPACCKQYNSFSSVTGLGITKIQDMNKNTRVFITVTSSNMQSVVDFISYNQATPPINIIANNNYCFSKFNIHISTTGLTICDVFILENLSNGEIVHGYRYQNPSVDTIKWYPLTDTSLLKPVSGADSKTVGDIIFREGNTANVRPYLRNYGDIEYVTSSQTTAISELDSIGISSPLDMGRGTYIAFRQTTALPNLANFLGDFTPVTTFMNGYYILHRIHLYSSTDVFILYESTGQYMWYGRYDSSSTPAILWSENLGSYSVTTKLNSGRTNFTPKVMGIYSPTSEPFDPWNMPENSIYYGSPQKWYEDSEHNAFVDLDRKYFEQVSSQSTPKALVGTTYQIIRTRYGLEISCGFRKQFFYGNKTTVGGTVYETWGTVGIENNITNEYNVENNITQIVRSGNVAVNPEITTDTNNFLSATGTTDDRTAEIETMLSTGCCILGIGDFYISDLVMPNYSCLKGCGNKTRLIWSKATGSTCMLQMGHNCNIENLKIDAEGSYTSPFYANDTVGQDERPIPNFTAILYQNHTETLPLENLNQSKISNVTINNCLGVGIKTTNSTSLVDRNLLVINCHIRDCICGIYNESIDSNNASEFHKFTNVIITHCFYGCIVTAGNIIYNNCNFGTCHIGAKLGAGYNDSHGIFNACLFIHCCDIYGVNTTSPIAGYTLKIDNITVGEKFNTCNFGFGKITINSSNSVSFSNCGISHTGIELNGYTTNTLFNGCGLGADVNYTQQENVTKTHIINCFTQSGDEWNG